MTLSALIAYTKHHTGYSEPEILSCAQVNWPDREQFSATQARLLVWLIEKERGKMGTSGAETPFESPATGGPR
jgi:hypothetical protein